MEDNETVNEKAILPVKHQFAKLVLGTAAGFLASKAAEAVYDKVIEKMSKTPENTPE